MGSWFSFKAPHGHVQSLLIIILFSLTFTALALADQDSVGTRWAVLIAGSNGYGNYRHQADVCHAYQILKKGGLKDENIIVFMYDDIAHNKENPRPGVIINSPNGTDVYKGVPKDYTGDAVNVNNFLSVILGNKTAIKGGSGKVVDSGPNDRIFIYYSDHGGPGVLGMPTYPYLYAKDVIDTLKKKYASGTYKSLVFYLESCESGSIFEGLLPQNLNIYVTTAANATENSWGTYCPGDSPAPPHEYTTCLGDLYSISWLEDCDVDNMGRETLNQQYELVKNRTGDGGDHASHVMQYGNLAFKTDDLSTYFGIGTNTNLNYLPPSNHKLDSISDQRYPSTNIVHQRDAEILHLWNKFWKAPQGSSKKIESERELKEAISSRMHVDKSVETVGKLLFAGHHNVMLTYARPTGQPLVDDWECLKSLVKTYENYCGRLSQYGMKHMRSFANMCNIGINNYQMTKAAGEACSATNT